MKTEIAKAAYPFTVAEGPQFGLPTGNVNGVLPILETGPSTKLALDAPLVDAVLVSVSKKVLVLVIIPEVMVKLLVTVFASANVTPPIPFIVRFLIFPRKVPAGKGLIATVFAKTTVPILASIFPVVRLTLPAMVSVFTSVFNVPAVNVNALFTVTFVKIIQPG